MMLRTLRTLAAVIAVVSCALRASAAGDDSASAAYPVVEKSVATLQSDLAQGRVTSEALTRAYLDRIAAIDAAGPTLQSVIALNPHALDEARRSDSDRAAGKKPRLLEGIPVLLKDNIETNDGIATTAGSDALIANIALRDAPLVTRLRDAGAIVLGKTNLSEWANFRSSTSISGWSAVGGLVKNPYALDRSACGSSSGTGAAIAASLAAVGVGTETDGSVTCPSAINGLVGLKPTLGLISRTHVVPLSHDQDTAGPMGRSVADVAALLTVLAGSDVDDHATAAADAHKRDYLAALEGASLAGKRFGVLRYAAKTQSDAVNATFTNAIGVLRSHGATIVELPNFKPNAALGDAEFSVLLTDFKTDINAYLATTPPSVKARSLAALIAFDRADRRELGLFGQDIFEKAEATKGPNDPKYRSALRICRTFAGPQGIDRVMLAHHLDALIAPTYSPTSRIDIVDGDQISGSVASLAAVAGYPHLTVPMGAVRGLPVGISFVGRAWSEASLLAIGAAYERASSARMPPSYPASIESAPDAASLLRSEASAPP